MTAYTLIYGSPESAGMDPERVKRLRSLVSSWVSCGDTPSAVALIARRGIIVMHEAFGVRHYADTTPTLKRDAIFPVMSCAKTLTAAAVMCLVEDGLIGLNRPFVDYIPELDRPEVEGLADAKVADLLCHTAGFDDIQVGAFVASAVKDPQQPPPGLGQHPAINARIRLAAGWPLAHKPGSAFNYSAYAYTLLSDIVRRVSGQPFWQFVATRLFEPLGMHDSYFKLPPDLRARRVFRLPGMPATEPTALHGGIDSPEYDEIDFGSGGALSTANDLAVFLQMLLNGGSYAGARILNAASVSAMTRSQVDSSIPVIFPRRDAKTGKWYNSEIRSGGYGYGLAIFDRGGTYRSNGSLTSLTAFGHGGAGGAYMWADPDNELVGVYLSVAPRFSRLALMTNSDLFQNAVHAAIVD